jgi:hypothetical protein
MYYYAILAMLFLGFLSGLDKLNNPYKTYSSKNLLDYLFPGSF